MNSLTSGSWRRHQCIPARESPKDVSQSSISYERSSTGSSRVKSWRREMHFKRWECGVESQKFRLSGKKRIR
ncbi:unnamed protein product [Acanthoscelides obtectus]|uniref:Uncharacterized protein n=1 Tax=Acanthoscelides obtectus TaxID=200917 RepID=A0A9P0L5B5_ACAOB|nr:unnamed protein product [Acanthoscelides obtectus]CAK1654614.1 hypothetical protein AOBTE_LOCUS18715 [Acanthoscelides obtectus]